MSRSAPSATNTSVDGRSHDHDDDHAGHDERGDDAELLAEEAG